MGWRWAREAAAAAMVGGLAAVAVAMVGPAAAGVVGPAAAPMLAAHLETTLALRYPHRRRELESLAALPENLSPESPAPLSPFHLRRQSARPGASLVSLLFFFFFFFFVCRLTSLGSAV